MSEQLRQDKKDCLSHVNKVSGHWGLKTASNFLSESQED